MTEILKPEERVNFTLRELYHRYGYRRFKMSKFEPYELYMRNKDFLISDGVLTFTDTDGTLMALKPDVTLSIVKNYRSGTELQKVYYSENVYRIGGGDRTYREIMQTGLECMGNVGIYDICEVILLAVRSLQAISSRFVLDISHMQLISRFMEQIPSAEQASVLQAVADKNIDALSRYPSLQRLLCVAGPMRKALPKLAEICGEDAVYRRLCIILQVLEQHGLADHVELDLSLVNDMNYYNGIVFRGYVEGVPTGVLSGGEYDSLMEKMDKKAGGIGFAVYLDQLERLELNKKRYDVDTLLLYEEEEDIPALTALAEEQSKLGSVLLLRNKPEQLRCARILKYTDGRLELIEDHG